MLMKFTPHLFQPRQRNARECNSCLWRLHRACHGSPQLEQSIPSFWRIVCFDPNMFSIFFSLSLCYMTNLQMFVYCDTPRTTIRSYKIYWTRLYSGPIIWSSFWYRWYSAYICNIRILQTIFTFTSITEAGFLPDLLLCDWDSDFQCCQCSLSLSIQTFKMLW